MFYRNPNFWISSSRGREVELCGLCDVLFLPARPSSQQPLTHAVMTPRVPLSHLSSPLQLKSGHAMMSVQAIVPLITAKSQSKLEMVRAIWFWLCHNIGKSGPSVSQSRGGAESPFLECNLLDFGSSCPAE